MARAYIYVDGLDCNSVILEADVLEEHGASVFKCRKKLAPFCMEDSKEVIMRPMGWQ